jgi:hypothetical protein
MDVKMDLKVIFKTTSKGKDYLLCCNYGYYYKRPIIGDRNFVCKDKKFQASQTIQNDTNTILKINAKATSGTSELELQNSHVNHPIITDAEILVLESIEILKKRVQTENTSVQQLFQEEQICSK